MNARNLGWEYAEYEAYKRSFGLQARLLRDERLLSDIAAAVSQIVSEGLAVSERDVRKWEKARAMPNEEQLEALMQVLIDRNNKFTGYDAKEAARKVNRTCVIKSPPR